MLASTGTGDIIPDATVTVRQSGTTNPITETIFANDDPDTTQLTNGVFKTDARGLAVFYLTNQKRVDVLFTKSGWTSVTIPVDVQKSSLVSGYATAQDEGVALPQQATLNFIGNGVTAADDAANGRTNVTIKPVATDPIWDAAGDLVYGTGADAASRLAIGIAGQVLKVNSGATAPEWGAAASSIPANDSALVATLEGTTSTSFTDLTTAGPAVTVTTGTKAMVTVTAEVRSSLADSQALMGFAVSGATTLAASQDRALNLAGPASVFQSASWSTVLEGLTAGANTFTSKYASGAGSSTTDFRNRRISVVDMGS